jgi:uncharacterized protein YegL
MASQQSSRPCVYPVHTILENTLLEFHTNTNTNKIPKELLCNMDITSTPNINESFGCLEIHTGETTINIDPVFFLFTIDESGSMSEICKDGKTKMDHIHFTMNQMLLYFAENPEATIYVHVNAFHDKVRTVIETTQVTNKNVNDIIEQIKKIRPQNSTNLELALKTANQTMHDHLQTTSKITCHSHRIVHVLLTDGHPTMGDSSESSLASLVDDTFSNVFIAFGLDHNPLLMNKLGNAGKNTTNYLVKNLELIGHVYGEIVHNHLFKVLDNVVLDVVGEEGTIYDWYSNEWKTTLHISPLTSESKKYYYVKSKNPYNTIIKISGNPIDTYAGTYFEEYVDKMPDLVIVKTPTEETSDEESQTEEIVDVDLTKHIFRLCTQRLLYEARQYANGEETNNYDDDLPLSQQAIPFLKRSYNYNSQHQDINDDILTTPPPPKLERNKTTVYKLDLEEIPEFPTSQEHLTQDQSHISKLDLLKSQIRAHLKYMSDYLEQTNNQNNQNNQHKQFIKTLCDDMDVALKTIGTRNQQSYINARSTSQGKQQIYNVNINDEISHPSEPLDPTDTSDQQTTQDINNAYATPTALKLMRGFSQR